MKNKANKTHLPRDKQNYKKQQNLVTKLNKQFKKEYFDNIEHNTDYKNLWNKCKPYFSNKYDTGDSKILVIEKEEIINKSNEIANVFNSYFESVTESLNLFNWAPEPYDQAKDSEERIVQRFSHHPSIVKIKQNINILKKNSFTPVAVETVKNIIYGLPQNKSVSGDIPLNVLRCSEFTCSYLTECINEVLRNSKYPESLKLSDIVPVYKKKYPTDKSNFRPISILALLSKLFEKVIFDQLSNYMKKFLNSLFCGFRKTRSKQHALFRLLQAWQKELDQCRFVGTILVLWMYLKRMTAYLMIYLMI